MSQALPSLIFLKSILVRSEYNIGGIFSSNSLLILNMYKLSNLQSL